MEYGYHDMPSSMCPDVFEIVRSAILLGQEGLTGVELAGLAAGTLGGVRTVEVGNVTVADIPEPMEGNKC
jgi:hypothetical protein